MKKTNKGFSLVELIIVIAIMAILAGALAPALIKYINKSRLSTDISTGQTIASAITTAMSNETAYEDAPEVTAATLESIGGSANGKFSVALDEIVDSQNVTVKSKKDMDGSTLGGSDFLVTIDPTANVVQVYAGDTGHMVYPDVATSMKESK